MQLLSPPSISSADGCSDGNNDANYDTTDWGNVWKWMNKLISLVNRVIEKGLANPGNFHRSVSKVIEELLEDVKSDYVWALDYFLFRVYESIWLGDQKSPKFGDVPISTTKRRFEEPCGLCKHLHLRPHKYCPEGRGYGMDFRIFEERKLYLEGHEEGVDFLDTLMAYVETALDLDTPEEKFGPLGTWQDTKPASSLLDSPAGPQEKSLMDKLNGLYPLDQPKIPTKNGYKVMPPWSVPMPWNFDKERDIFDNYAAIPLYLQGMTIRVDWPAYTIRPALTRAQERRLKETSPDMEMAKLHRFGHRMILACARLNDWVRCMNQRQLIPLHIFLAGTVLADNPGHFGYNAVRKMGEGYEEWREDPHGYLECIRPSDVFEEDERSSSSVSNPWEEEDRAWSDGDEGWQQD